MWKKNKVQRNILIVGGLEETKSLAKSLLKKEYVTALKNANGLGACDVYQAADGTTYVLGYVAGAGMSMFKLK